MGQGRAYTPLIFQFSTFQRWTREMLAHDRLKHRSPIETVSRLQSSAYLNFWRDQHGDALLDGSITDFPVFSYGFGQY